MKIAVTGGLGHLGRVLCQQFLDSNIAVRILDVRTPTDSEPPGEFRLLDVTDPKSVQGSLDGCDVVVHLAALLEDGGDAASFERVNYRGTCLMKDEALRANVRRFVFISSISVLYRQGNAYSISKAKAENALSGSPLSELVILRPTLVICDGGAQEFARFAKLVRRLPVLPLPGGGKAHKRPVHARDLALAIVKASLVPLPSRISLDLPGKQVVTLDGLARRVRSRDGRTLKILPVPLWLAHFSAWATESIFRIFGRCAPWNRQILSGLLEDAAPDPSNARSLLGWDPSGLDDFFPTTRLPGDKK